jgi:Spermidine/putrescine-binding periplasmic protein
MKDRDPDAKPASTAMRGSLSRRRALKTIGGAGLVASAAPFIVRRAFADSAQPMGPGGIPLARPEHPVTLPMYEDPLKAGMAPETGGDFVVYVYADYIDKGLVNEFCKAHGVNMQLTTYDSQDEAITKQATHAVRPDVVNITPDRLAQGVAGKLIKPINHSYIPNLAANVWDGLQSPFYDVGSQYTVPYTSTRRASAGDRQGQRGYRQARQSLVHLLEREEIYRLCRRARRRPRIAGAWRCSIASSTTSTPRIRRRSTRPSPI